MKDLKIYILTVLISLLLVLPVLFCNSVYTTVLSGIGCSGIAASIMAVFLERASYNREKDNILKAKSLYFRQLNDELTTTIERILWFNDRLEDSDFNWKLDDHIYSSYKYMVSMSSKYPGRVISFEDAIEELKIIGKKFRLELYKQMPEEEKYIIQKMFRIVAVGSLFLINEANTIRQDQLILEIEKYISLSDTKDLLNSINLSISLMQKDDKNYEVPIIFLIQACEKVRKIGRYSNRISVGLHGTVPINDL